MGVLTRRFDHPKKSGGKLVNTLFAYYNPRIYPWGWPMTTSDTPTDKTGRYPVEKHKDWTWIGQQDISFKQDYP